MRTRERHSASGGTSTHPAKAPVTADALKRLEEINILRRALSAPGKLRTKLQNITDSLADLFELDFCRVWLVKPGDLCEKGCIHAELTDGPHTCHDHTKCLALVASSGYYGNRVSKMHQRVPFGCYKIGRVGAGQDRKFLTNNLANDSRVLNHETAGAKGFVAFAGYRLAAHDGSTLGVFSFLAKHTISSEEDAMLDSLAESLSEAIHSAKANEKMVESEKKFRTLFESSNEGVILVRKGVFIECNAATLKIFSCPTRKDFLSRPIEQILHPEQEGGIDGFTFILDKMADAMESGSAEFQCRCLRRGDSAFPAEMTLTSFQLEGQRMLQWVVRDITERAEAEAERERLIAELQKALREIKRLSGLLPICASCKKIRDDKGYWNTVEEYISENSEAEFSHGVCPECYETLYPELAARHKIESKGD